MIAYFFAGLTHSFLLAKLWNYSAKGHFIACFFLSLVISVAAFININLAAKDQALPFAIYALGQAIGLAYGVHHNNKIKSVEKL